MTVPSTWDGVIGQDVAVERLHRAAERPVHAYLFAGPRGSTKRQAARAFAAALIGAGDDPAGRDARLVLAGEHPDVREVERVGPAISAEQAREIVRVSSLAPVEGDRKVLVLHDFHLLRPEGAALLLKTVEEPPPSTVFVILADFVPNDLITIASRCARIEFRPIPDEAVADQLVLEGVDPDSATAAAHAAHGDLDRARVLAADPDLAHRRRAFAGVPARLDGTGATVVAIVEELVSLIDDASAPLGARHAREVAELDERIARYGERGSGKKALEERHKRELRRHRTDEWRDGLATLAGAYRDALVAGHPARPDAIAEAVSRVHEAIEALDRNPNEPLLLQSLLWSLPAL